MNIANALTRLLAGGHLSRAEMNELLLQMISGEATDAQIGGLLIALLYRQESAEELVGAAEAMRALAVKVRPNSRPLTDTCGTGGSGTGMFNVSTASAFVLAAAGAHVAKHGNRSISGNSGSADLLTCAGAAIDLEAEAVAQCIDTLGVGFMMAPMHHSSARRVAGPRRELGVRTLFNLLGPLTNPADAEYQLTGVFAERWLAPMAKALADLGLQRAMVVHSDGLDELGLSAPSAVVEVRDGKLHSYSLTPEDVGLERAAQEPLCVSSPEESLQLVRAALCPPGEGPPEVDAGTARSAAAMVALNSGAALYVSGISPNIPEGVKLAGEILRSGDAFRTMEAFVALTQKLKPSQ